MIRGRVSSLAQVAIVVFLFFLPSLTTFSGYQLQIINLVLLWIPLALGLLVIMGLCGQINLAVVALYGVGAYTAAILVTQQHLNPWLATLFGSLAGGFIGMLVGLPSLRIRSHYLAIATLGLAVAAEAIFTNGGQLTGGPLGINNIPALPGLDVSKGRNIAYYPLLLTVAAGAWIFCRMLAAGPIGAAFGAIRDDHLAAKGVGVNVGAFQLLAFIVSGLMAGLAGSLYATWFGYISPDSFRPAQMFFLLTILLVGGMRSLPGVLIATTALIVVREAFQKFEAYQLIFYGILVVIITLVAPDGLAGLASRVAKRLAGAVRGRTPRPAVQPLAPSLPPNHEQD
jgi:branched-chain amino acid transport system permease protein